MKSCPSCKMNVVGDTRYCPLCQNELIGDEADLYYPKLDLHTKGSFVYKLQFFLCLTVMVICLAIDFMLHRHGALHWSLFVVIWVIGGQMCANTIIKRHRHPAQVITKSAAWLIVLVTPTLLILGYKDFYFWYVLPGIMTVMLILDFIFALIDKSQNAMAYILTSCFVGIVASIGFIHYLGEKDLIWVICLTICVVMLMALIIFRGKKTGKEIQKRLNV